MENLKINMLNIKDIAKLGTTIIIQANVEVLHIAYNLKYSVPKVIFIVFFTMSNYGYYFITKRFGKRT